ncbi:MAG: allantoate amidohydrolase [Pseudolabrys sp.]
MNASDPKALGARAVAMIEALGTISAEPDRLVRLFLTPEHRRAADLVAGWMREAGLQVSEDALGTVRGRMGEDLGDGCRLLIGSHIDTVIDAGKYDGPLGVIAGIIAADEIRKRKVPVAIDVLAFGDEEGSRFPSTLSSSSAVAGVFETAMLGFADRDGVTFADALKSYGKSTSDIAAAAYKVSDVAGYIEIHIEQGPRLEAAQQPLGVVTGIVGQTRLKVTVGGEAGHAGTVPMELRHDALAGAAAMILAVEAIARQHGDMVATVGRIEALPGATNVIPAQVTFTVDLRCMDDAARSAAIERFGAESHAAAAARGLTVRIETFHDVAAVPCDEALRILLARAVEDVGGKPIHLPSGAGHDAQIMARLCPSAMLFVRCRDGVSHNPSEYASPEDIGLAIAALIHFIERFSELSGSKQ